MRLNNNSISIHPGLLIIILGIISGAFVAWGIISVNNVKVSRNEKDILENKVELKRIDQEKADKTDVNRIYKILDEIQKDIKDIKNGRSNK